jgi:hypothetical protein
MSTLLELDRRLKRLEMRRCRNPTVPVLTRLAQDPTSIFAQAGMAADTWQMNIVSRSSVPRTILLCTRQGGKSTVAAALALLTAFLEAPALILLLSPTLRQSGELYRDKVCRLYNSLGRPVPTIRETALTTELANGSRILSLPGDEGNIRGYSGVRLLVIDEAARVPDELYRAVRPMLAVSGGRLLALSTPWGRRGWFCEAWHSTEPWQRVRVPAEECPRISREFLEAERIALGERFFEQEYRCVFADTVEALFSEEDIIAVQDDSLPPLFPEFAL